VDLYRAIVATGGHARLVLLPTKASVPGPGVAPGPRPRARTMAAGLRRGRHPRYRLSRYPVPAASLTPIGSAWSGRATGRGGARPRPCGG
jgi:hypothetical protein